MIALNDYLYSGHTVLKILHNYQADLHAQAERLASEGEPSAAIDTLHSDFMLQLIDILEHNDFLTSQSQRIREFYKYMAQEYPWLAFTFKGRIKSLIRAEEKFNGYIVEFVSDYYRRHGAFPDAEQLKPRLNCFRDLIAYRIVISLPVCHVSPAQNRQEEELKYLYEIANALPGFLEARGFEARVSESRDRTESERLAETLRPYYRDYIENPTANGYRSLHITFFDNISNSFTEVQLRTKDMDDYAEIGAANHMDYEKSQNRQRTARSELPEGQCRFFDEALAREILLEKLELSELDVNMFGAVNNSLINDGCGLFRGRLILPFEHLSGFQNDLID